MGLPRHRSQTANLPEQPLQALPPQTRVLRQEPALPFCQIQQNRTRLEHDLLNLCVLMPQCRDLSSWHLSNLRGGVLVALRYIDRQ